MYLAQAIDDLDIPPGSVCFAGSVLCKSWVIKNTGTYYWPVGTRLKHVDGNIIPLQNLADVSRPAPGYTTRVFCQIRVKSNLTKMQSGTFRLVTPQGTLFGGNIKVVLNVRVSPFSWTYDSDSDTDDGGEKGGNMSDINEEKNTGKNVGSDNTSSIWLPSSSASPNDDSNTGHGNKPAQKKVQALSKESDSSQRLSSQNKTRSLSETFGEDPDVVMPGEVRFGIKVGEGSFGEVFHGTVWGQDVALKLLRVDFQKMGDYDRVVQEFEHEVQVMRQLRHPNIVEFLGVCYESPNLCMVTEFCPNGTVQTLVYYQRKRGNLFSNHKVLRFVGQIARGLNWLHHKGIVHRDLKPANILVDQHNTLKIADFGLSHIKKSSGEDASGLFGSPCYIAPEVLKAKNYGTKADIFSLGVIMCDIATLWQAHENMGIVAKSWLDYNKAILAGTRPIVHKEVHPALAKVIQQCWNENPAKRPTGDTVVKELEKIERALDDAGTLWRQLEQLNDSAYDQAYQLYTEQYKEIQDLKAELAQSNNVVRTLTEEVESKDRKISALTGRIEELEINQESIRNRQSSSHGLRSRNSRGARNSKGYSRRAMHRKTAFRTRGKSSSERASFSYLSGPPSSFANLTVRTTRASVSTMPRNSCQSPGSSPENSPPLKSVSEKSSTSLAKALLRKKTTATRTTTTITTTKKTSKKK